MISIQLEKELMASTVRMLESYPITSMMLLQNCFLWIEFLLCNLDSAFNSNIYGFHPGYQHIYDGLIQAKHWLRCVIFRLRCFRVYNYIFNRKEYTIFLLRKR